MPSVVKFAENTLAPSVLSPLLPAALHHAPFWCCAAAMAASNLAACIPAPPSESDADITDAAVVVDGAPPIACDVIPSTDCPDPRLRYTTNIEPIIKARCIPCHDGRGPQWPLLTYGNVTDWYDQVATMVGNCSMPPPDAGMPLASTDREQLLSWLHCGYPE